MKRTALLLLLLALLPAAAIAQVTIDTGPVTATDKAEYDLTDATSAAQAAATEVRLRVDATTGTFHVVVAPSCVANVAPALGFKCTGGLPASILPVLNTRGKHAIRAYAFDAGAGVEGPSDIPFVLTTPAAAPMRLRLFRSGP